MSSGPKKRFTVKHASVSDAADNVRHLNQVGGETKFCSFDGGEYYRTVEEEEKRFKDIIDSKAGVVAVVRDDDTGELVGSGLCTSKVRRSRHVFLLGLTVCRSHWRMGIGSALMEFLMGEAEKLGAEKIVLDVAAFNTAAIALYKKFGFVEEGRLKNEIKVDGVYEDIVFMGKILRQ